MNFKRKVGGLLRGFLQKLQALVQALLRHGNKSLPAAPSHLTILHFNDVYNIEGVDRGDGKLRGGAARFLSKVWNTHAGSRGTLDLAKLEIRL